MMKVTDKRTGRKTFKEIKVGQGFTIPEDDDVYIKIDIIEEASCGYEFNAVGFKTGELYEIDDTESVEEISEIEIIIK